MVKRADAGAIIDQEKVTIEPRDTAEMVFRKILPLARRLFERQYDALLAGTADVIVAGGMESMSNAPYLLPKARSGYRMGHQQVLDHMFLDGLEDAYDRGRLMGTFAEDTARHYQLTRQD